ncbi:MAG: threonine ammonia-lyase [Phycisphaerales bacterium]|nr:threonine ammonia-lyase [Phycisphaerales bacterium]
MPVPESAPTVSFEDILAARRRIAGAVFETPCRESVALSELCGARVFCKLEFQQRTGSFKERGARNALLQLTAENRQRGIVAASAGNHAAALAYHGRELGIPVTVVMPVFAPLVKQERCKALGARVLLHGSNIAEAKDRADEMVARDGLIYIHGFNGPQLIAGQGTIGLELIEQVPSLDAVIVPIGGGGLIAGVALAIKKLRPSVRVIGVEPSRCASFQAALRAGRPVMVAGEPTLADGLAVPQVGDLAFAIARPLVDEVVSVDEESISLAMLRLVECEKGVVEGAGAVGLAAFLEGHLRHLRGRTVVLLLCGGNVDPMTLSRVITHGLAVDGRLVQFTAMIKDRPGGLADLASALAAAGASVQQVTHERAFGGPDVSMVQVLCEVEVRGPAHAEQVYAALRERGIRVLARTQVESRSGVVGRTVDGARIADETRNRVGTAVPSEEVAG